ncbi:unnamed protein product [Ixodes persulcatus]
MVQILCSRVFCGELFTVNLRTKKELCDVRVRRILQLNDSTESYGTCSVDVVSTSRLRNLKGASNCQLDTVGDWNSGLIVLVLAVHCGDRVRTFRYDMGSRHFDPLAEVEIANPNHRSWTIGDGPSLAVLETKALTLRSLEPNGLSLQATLPDGTSADTILASCSVELLFSSSSENVRAILCVVAAKQRLHFVAATVAGTAEVLPAVFFLGSLYEESQMRACTVVPSEPAVKVKGASELKEAFTDNTTAVCTASGTLLVLERGRCLHRCQLPFTDSTHIICGLRPDNEGYLVVWASTGGVVLLGLSSVKQLQVLHRFPAECSVVCGDLLRCGIQQAVSFSPEKADTISWRLLGQDRRPSEAGSIGGMRDVIEALHHHSAAGQAALHKTRRALAQCEALLEEAVEVITARQLGGIAESRLQDACGHLVPVLPSGQASPICLLPEETSASESVMLLHSWAHIWGPQLLLGWVFQRPPSMRTQPPTFLASPGITFGVRVSMDPKRVTIASSCRLPAEPTLRVVLVAGPLRHHQTVVLDEVRTVNLQDPRTTGVQVAKEVVASQRAAQETRCFWLDSVPPATANELLLGLFDRVAPGLYVCCQAFSPLLRASADLFEEQSGALCLSLYAEDAAQHELLKRRLVCRFPGDVGWTPRSSLEEDERLASALREEARLATALADQPERYVALRRELQEAEWQTDFLAQGLFDRQASATNQQ